MPVCRICLKQSYKSVFDLDFGSPSIRAKLLTCISNINSRFFDSNYCICELCFTALNTAYELREMQMAAEADIKSAMINVDDYANLNKYVHEAAKRREKLYNNKIQIRADGILLNDIKEEEQLAAIATIDSTPSTSGSGAPLPIFKRPRPLKPICTTNVPFQSGTLQTLGSPNVFMPAFRNLPPNGEEFVLPGTSAATATMSRTTTNGTMCHICFRQYPNPTCLMSHIRSVHNMPGKNKAVKRTGLSRKLCLLTPSEMRAVHLEVAKKCVETKCDECRITLKCTHELQYHIAAIHKCCDINTINFNVRCDVCSLSIGHQYLKLHMQGHRLQVKLTNIFETIDEEAEEELLNYWLCQTCKTIFRSDEHSMEDHLKLHEVVTE